MNIPRRIAEAVGLVAILLWCFAEAFWSVVITGKPSAFQRMEDI